MSSCLPDCDLQELGDAVLSGFGDRVSAIPKDLCVPFYDQAGRLEAELLMIHKLVVICVRKEEDLSVVAAKWAWMAKMCDESAKRLNTLSIEHPLCGAGVYYDRILDLRAKCLRLEKMHS
jgi:hypothetical protein